MKTLSFVVLSLAALAIPAHAISVATAGPAYTQNFDGLASSGTNNSWTNDSTLPGWSLFQRTSGGTAITAYNAGDGSSNTGSFYSYGTAGSTERALGGAGAGGAYFGSPATGAIAGWIAVSFSNGSGGIFDGFAVSWDGEQWRNGGNTSAQTMVFEYGFGSSFNTVPSWTTPGGTFDFTSVVNTASAAAVVGNSAGLGAGRGGAVSNLSWTPTDTLWLRWVELNDSGNDHGLAIDNFSFAASRSSASVPEGGATFGMLALSFAGLAALHPRPVRR